MLFRFLGVLGCVHGGHDDTRERTPTRHLPQTLDVKQQLDAGVRYLDLRIAHMQGGSEKNLHFEHMIYTTALVEVGVKTREGGVGGGAECISSCVL